MTKISVETDVIDSALEIVYNCGFEDAARGKPKSDVDFERMRTVVEDMLLEIKKNSNQQLEDENNKLKMALREIMEELENDIWYNGPVALAVAKLALSV